MPTVETQTVRIMIHEINAKSRECVTSLPPELAERFSLSAGDKLSVKVGRVTKEAVVRIEPSLSVSKVSPLGLSDGLFATLWSVKGLLSSRPAHGIGGASGSCRGHFGSPSLRIG